jgi:hypothetical protein
MTLLQDIVDGASGSGVDVATLLRKVKVLAARTHVDQLAEWVGFELEGYLGDDSALPGYRGPFQFEVLGTFAGYFQSQIQNAPIPPSLFPESMRDGWLFRRSFREPIAEIETLADRDDLLRIFWPADVIAYTNSLIKQRELKLYDGFLQQAFLAVPSTLLTTIVDAVRTRILDLALEFERLDPEAGQPDADQPDVATARTIVTNIIGGHHNIAVASTSVQQHVEMPRPGNQEELVEFAVSLGVSGPFLDELRQALQEDADEPVDDGHGSGARVRAWLGRWMIHPGGAVAAGAGGELLARAVAHYLGAPF